MNNNEIEKIGTVIEVDVDSGITTNDNKNTIKKSKSRFSIHGINYPAGIFPDVNDRNKKAKLRWPIPMLLVIDITGTNDIDLNSSRTEIIFNKKWADFEKTLAEEILLAIKKKTNNEYWKKLLDILSKMNGSEIFNDVLNTLLLSH